MPIPAAPIIAGAASVLGQGINAYSTGKMNKRAERFAIKSYNTQRRDTLADWNMQNEYNSPEAAMQRLRKAGLNPNLVYGDGNAIQSAAPIKSPDGPATPNYRPQSLNFSGIGEAALSFYDIQMKEAQTNNLKAQNTLLAQDAILKALQAIGMDTGNKKSKLDLDVATELKSTTVEAAKLATDNLRKTGYQLEANTQSTLDANERANALQAPTLQAAVERVLSIRAERAKTNAERDKILQEIKNLKKDEKIKEYEIALNAQGISKSDPMWMRALTTLINKITGSNADKQKATTDVLKKHGLAGLDPMGTLFGN